MSSSKPENLGSNLEVDPAVLEDSAADSYDSSGFCTSTESLTSSINQYIFENGRRYHSYYGADKNLMPTDETEQDRLDLHHEIMLLLLEEKLHLAPIGPDPQKILDVGTGTGIWAVDCVDTYSNAEVIGTDLSWVPQNLKFEVDDMTQEWSYKDNSFDFIHIRNLSQSMSDWNQLIQQAYRCLKPGGYLEIAEMEFGTFSDDDKIGNGFRTWMEYLAEACEKLGRPTVTAERVKQILNDGGLEGIQVATMKQPFGPWAKDERMKKVGTMTMFTADSGSTGYGLALFTRVLDMAPEKALAVCKAGAADTKNKNYHMWTPFHVAYGRKPISADYQV